MRVFDHAERWFDRSRAALLGQIPCHRGCHRCCIGPFAITILDAALLREGLAELHQRIRHEIQARAEEHTALIEQEFPRLAQSRFLDDWPDADVDQLVGRFADLACPALGHDGSCRLYSYRPVTSEPWGSRSNPATWSKAPVTCRLRCRSCRPRDRVVRKRTT
ncbi:MAG: hypothetical protein ACREJU_06510 [Nitrospiraceae bacterium]